MQDSPKNQSNIKIAYSVNSGNCSECKGIGTLGITVYEEDGAVWGDVTCNICSTWITDLMPDEMEVDGGFVKELADDL